jgi:hypothetical protein
MTNDEIRNPKLPRKNTKITKEGKIMGARAEIRNPKSEIRGCRKKNTKIPTEGKIMGAES